MKLIVSIRKMRSFEEPSLGAREAEVTASAALLEVGSGDFFRGDKALV